MGYMTPPPRETKHTFWTSASGILTGVAAVITAVGAVIGAYLTTRSGEPGQPTPVPGQELATIYLQYRGDENQCAMRLTTKIAGKTILVPATSSVTVRDVPEGPQKYDVSGQVTCPTLGVFDARGSGTINVNSGDTYYFYWLQNAGTQTVTVTIVSE